MVVQIRYDDALPRFAAIVSQVLGEEALLDHFFLRDASGRLTFVHQAEITDQQKVSILEAAKTLRPYTEDDDLVVCSPSDLLDPIFQEPQVAQFEYVRHPIFEGFVRVAERRIVGQDWLVAPRDALEAVPPIVVFGSHKGGVGRSTALSVSANALAQNGYNVLVLDFDLEAPGIGGTLLPSQSYPKFGTLDYFVESVLAEVEDDFLDQMVGVSPLTQGRGSVHVCPAVGSVGEASPQNVLGKIARAYLESTFEQSPKGFLDRTRTLVRRLSEKTRYDAILVDSRAGLNEATAAAFLGLGADVLLFGVNTPQTFHGYRYLLAYLERFKPAESSENDWRYRLRMVHAKASPDPARQGDFRTQAFEMFADSLYDAELGVDETSFNFDYDDVSAPHYAWPILNDSNYSEFDPVAQPDQLLQQTYERTFGPFVAALFDRLGLSRTR